MSDQDYFRLALGEIEDDLKNDFKSGLGFGLISELVINGQNFFKYPDLLSANSYRFPLELRNISGYFKKSDHWSKL